MIEDMIRMEWNDVQMFNIGMKADYKKKTSFLFFFLFFSFFFF